MPNYARLQAFAAAMTLFAQLPDELVQGAQVERTVTGRFAFDVVTKPRLIHIEVSNVTIDVTVHYSTSAWLCHTWRVDELAYAIAHIKEKASEE